MVDIRGEDVGDLLLKKEQALRLLSALPKRFKQARWLAGTDIIVLHTRDRFAHPRKLRGYKCNQKLHTLITPSSHERSGPTRACLYWR